MAASTERRIADPQSGQGNQSCPNQLTSVLWDSIRLVMDSGAQSWQNPSMPNRISDTR